VSGFGLECSSISGIDSTSFSFTAFTADQFSYSATVQSQYSACVLSVTYSAGPVTLAYAYTSYSAAAPSSGSYTSSAFPLVVGADNIFTVDAGQDGLYTLTVHRDSWAVTSIS